MEEILVYSARREMMKSMVVFFAMILCCGSLAVSGGLKNTWINKAPVPVCISVSGCLFLVFLFYLLFRQENTEYESLSEKSAQKIKSSSPRSEKKIFQENDLGLGFKNQKENVYLGFENRKESEGLGFGESQKERSPVPVVTQVTETMKKVEISPPDVKFMVDYSPEMSSSAAVTRSAENKVVRGRGEVAKRGRRRSIATYAPQGSEDMSAGSCISSELQSFSEQKTEVLPLRRSTRLRNKAMTADGNHYRLVAAMR